MNYNIITISNNHAEHSEFIVGEKSNDVMHPDYTPSIFSFSSVSAVGTKEYLDRYARSASQSKRFKSQLNIEPSVPMMTMMI